VKLTAVLVEDVPVVRRHLESLLHRSTSIDVLRSVETLAAARRACAELKPDVLLTDLRLPDGHGLTLIREVRATLPQTHIMVISVLADAASVVAAIRAGAGGYMLKDDLPQDVDRLVRNLVAGRATLAPAIARHIVRSLQADTAPGRPSEALTTREREVLGLIAKGLSNADIGLRLRISAHTVGDHVRGIYRKLEVNSRSEAVFRAVSHNILVP
jgi:DNA-binding NarL/FixJ family response regulator